MLSGLAAATAVIFAVLADAVQKIPLTFTSVDQLLAAEGIDD
jgi:hypothetical protein